MSHTIRINIGCGIYLLIGRAGPGVGDFGSNDPDEANVRRPHGEEPQGRRSALQADAVIPASGHNIALAYPAALAQAYLEFFAVR